MLTKPILKALAEFDGAPELHWEFSYGELRTSPYGYALYCRTGVKDNGTISQRRLWCGDIERARQVGFELEARGIPDMLSEVNRLGRDVLSRDLERR